MNLETALIILYVSTLGLILLAFIEYRSKQKKREPEPQAKTKVHVVVEVFQGIAEDVHVYAKPEDAQKKHDELIHSPDYNEEEDAVGLYLDEEVQ